MSEKPLVIDVVDNGGQWTHREWRMLRYLKVDTQIIDNTTPVDQLRELEETQKIRDKKDDSLQLFQ